MPVTFGMPSTYRGYKQAIRTFMRERYTDERLAWLLAHARSGKLSFHSCCCFVGITTSDHTLVGAVGLEGLHYERMKFDVDLTTDAAEYAFRRLGATTLPTWADYRQHDALRRRIIIPMILAEMKRRDKLTERATNVVRQFAEALEAR